MSAQVDIIITSNGRKTAKLSAYENKEKITTANGFIKERAELYEVPAGKASYEEFLKLAENSDERYS